MQCSGIINHNAYHTVKLEHIQKKSTELKGSNLQNLICNLCRWEMDRLRTKRHYQWATQHLHTSIRGRKRKKWEKEGDVEK